MTRTHGINMDSWYRQGQVIDMCAWYRHIDNTHGIDKTRGIDSESWYTHTRGPDVAHMEDFFFFIIANC